MPGTARRLAATICLIFATLVIETYGKRPQLWPNREQIQMNEGDKLEITCLNDNRVHFGQPGNTLPADENDIVTSPFIENSAVTEDGKYETTFLRKNAIYGDTGWYTCVSKSVNITSDIHQHPQSSSMYVYVKSKKHLFATGPRPKVLRVVEGNPATIPCRPTSPNLHVSLVDGSNNDVGRERATYDPRIGFTLYRVTIIDSGYYTCEIQKDGAESSRDYNLLVHRSHAVQAPKITVLNRKYIHVGDNLTIWCNVTIDKHEAFSFDWITPESSKNNRNITFGQNMELGFGKEAYSKLIIKKVTFDDGGEYTCKIKTFGSSNSSSVSVNIRDPAESFLHLNFDDGKRKFERNTGQFVEWNVNIDAYPWPNITWTSPSGSIISTPASYDKYLSKRKVETIVDKSTTLRINRLVMSDMGEYLLEASIPGNKAQLSFHLLVNGSPKLFLDTHKSYYYPGERINIRCRTHAYPHPNVSASFVECPNFPSLDDSVPVPMEISIDDSMARNPLAIGYLSAAVNLTIEMSGIFTCTSCNEVHCVDLRNSIFVSDVHGGFGIVEKKAEYAVGDNIALTCAASIYNYTEVEWLDGDEHPLNISDRINVTYEKTKFTHRAVLHIKNIQMNDSKDYTCATKVRSGIDKTEIYQLNVKEPASPRIVSSNMNETGEIEIDFASEGFKTLILTCYVSGLPKPFITWFRDDEIIEESEQYKFLEDRQVLRIEHFLQQDSGTYLCNARNRIGSIETFQKIVIIGGDISKAWIFTIVILIVILFSLTIYFCIKIRKEKKMRKELVEVGLTYFENGAIECLNPALTVDDQAELLPYDKKWEFPRERLKLGKQLGRGAFGVVMKAEARGIIDEEESTTVAVKMVRETTDPSLIRALASELKIMVHLGKHLNVVNLLGACTNNIIKRDLLVIVEFCRYGNLHDYLMRHREYFIDQIDPNTKKIDQSIRSNSILKNHIVSDNRLNYAALSFSHSVSTDSANGNSAGTETVILYQDSQGNSTTSPESCVMSSNSSQPGWRSNYRGDYKDQNTKPLCTQDLLSWAFQVARGMEYLTHRKVLHGDLAARNILLAENNVVKICDFGLAKSMYKNDNYLKTDKNCRLPIKWMAIESIVDGIFSTQSDVWSYGIVLWEFFTLASTPYPAIDVEKVCPKLIEGYRMKQPDYAPSEMYDIMMQCWRAQPGLRPTFGDLVESVGDLLGEAVKSHYVDLNSPYMAANAMSREGKEDYLTMMSSPDHAILSSPTHDYINNAQLSTDKVPDSAYLTMKCASPGESEIINPNKDAKQQTYFEFPPPSQVVVLDAEEPQEEDQEDDDDDDDNYLKPINIQKKRAAFMKKREAEKRNSHLEEKSQEGYTGYYNTRQALMTNDAISGKQAEDMVDGNAEGDSARSITMTFDNYVNMPKQKKELKNQVPDSYSNPSYIYMDRKT